MITKKKKKIPFHLAAGRMMRKLLIMDEGILGRRINRLQSTVMIMVFHHLGARFSFSSPLTCELMSLMPSFDVYEVP